MDRDPGVGGDSVVVGRSEFYDEISHLGLRGGPAEETADNSSSTDRIQYRASGEGRGDGSECHAIASDGVGRNDLERDDNTGVSIFGIGG